MNILLLFFWYETYIFIDWIKSVCSHFSCFPIYNLKSLISSGPWAKTCVGHFPETEANLREEAVQ